MSNFINSFNHLLIFLYGNYDKVLRSKEEIKGIQEYTKSILSQAEKIKNLQTVTLSGGYTQVNQISEVESNLSLYHDFLKKHPKVQLIKENTSHTSLENIAFSYLTLRKYQPKKLIIACDSVRRQKIELLSRVLFDGLDLELDFIFANRKDSHPNSNLDYQFKTDLPKILASEKFRILRELITLN